MHRFASFAAGFLSCLLLIAAVGVLARVLAEQFVVLNCCSYHLTRNGQQEKNPGIGLEWDVAEKWRAVAGVYNNSSGDVSIYAGAVRNHLQIGRWRAGSLFAVVSGYERYPVPMVAPVISYEGRTMGVNLGLIPGAGGVFFAQAKWKF